jgi:hypothetical protein
MAINKIIGKEYIFGPLPITGTPNDARFEDGILSVYKKDTKLSSKQKDMAIPVQWKIDPKDKDTIIIYASGEFHLNGKDEDRRLLEIFVDNTQHVVDKLTNSNMYNLRCDYTKQAKEEKKGRLYYPRFDNETTEEGNKIQLLDFLYDTTPKAVSLIDKPNIDSSSIKFDFRERNIKREVKGVPKRKIVNKALTKKRLSWIYNRSNNTGVVIFDNQPILFYLLENFTSLDELLKKAESDLYRIFDTIKNHLDMPDTRNLRLIYEEDCEGELKTIVSITR